MNIEISKAHVPEGVLVPVQAVVFYENPCKKDEMVFATRHGVGKSNEGFSLSSGKPLTIQAVKALAKQAQKMIKSRPEILPQEVLMADESLIVWWRPAGLTDMLFDVSMHGEQSGRERLQGVCLSMHLPPLVFALRRGLGSRAWQGIYVYALEKNERPGADTLLFRAPLLNVNDEGSVCWGDGTLPEGRSVCDLNHWENMFFGSKFTHYNGSSPIKSSQPYEWLAEYSESRPESFPVEMLKPMNTSLSKEVMKLMGAV